MKAWITKEEHIEWVEPQASCLCFPRIKLDVSLDIDAFYVCLNDKFGTYVGPGHWFEESRRYFRIGYAWPTRKELEDGLESISAAINEVKDK